MALQPEHESPVAGLEAFDEVAGRAARPGVGDEPGRQVRRAGPPDGGRSSRAARRRRRSSGRGSGRAACRAPRGPGGPSPLPSRTQARDGHPRAGGGGPPENTLIAWKPRQIPRTGSPRRCATAHASASSASRAGSTAVDPRSVRAVPRGVDVGATAEQQAVHRRERIGQPLGRGGGVDHDRAGALAAHRRLVQGPLARGEVRIARPAVAATVTTMRGGEEAVGGTDTP